MTQTKTKRKLRWSGAMATLLAVTILLSGSGIAMAAGAQVIEVYRLPITFELNGENKQAPADQQGFIYENRTYIPLRFVSEALQLQVEWDGAASTVHINDQLQSVTAEKAAEQPVITARMPEQVTGYERAIEYTILGTTVSSDQAPSGWIIEQRLYVPLRFLAETAGATVHWDAQTYTAMIRLPLDTEEETAKPDENKPVEEVAEEDEVTPPRASEPGSSQALTPVGPEAPVAPPTPTPNPSVKSESTILRAAEAQIESLRTSCEGDLWSLGLQYLSSEPEDRKNLLAQGEAKLADCDRTFANIMTELETELSEHGYGTDAVSKYEQLYEEEKASARKIVDRLRG